MSQADSALVPQIVSCNQGNHQATILEFILLSACGRKKHFYPRQMCETSFRYCLYFQKIWYSKKLVQMQNKNGHFPAMFICQLLLKYLAFEKLCLQVAAQKLYVIVWPSPPGTFHFLIGKFSYFIIKFLDQIFLSLTFSISLLDFYLIVLQ